MTTRRLCISCHTHYAGGGHYVCSRCRRRRTLQHCGLEPVTDEHVNQVAEQITAEQDMNRNMAGH